MPSNRVADISSEAREEQQDVQQQHEQQQHEQQQHEDEGKKENQQAAADVTVEVEPEQKELLQKDFEDLDSATDGKLAKKFDSCLSSAKRQLDRCLPKAKLVLRFLLLIAFAVYFGFAMFCERLRTEGSVRLLVLTCCSVLLAAAAFAKRRFGSELHAAVLAAPIAALREFRLRHQTAVSAVGVLAFFAYFLGFVIGIGAQNLRNLLSGVGVCVIILLSLLLSANPARVNWRPVMGGLTIQITFAALLLRTQFGYDAFSFLGDRVYEFISHVDAGCEFVFGEKFRDHYFAFSVLPVIVFFSAFISLLFHLGILQAVIQSVGWVMQQVMGTTAAESLVAAANIFIGMLEAPLLIRPFVGLLTNSELHSVVSCGYATIAGGVLAAFIGLGVPARHLLSASVMMAPGALALSKILYPETKKSKTDSDSIKKIEVGKYYNAIDAIGTGAVNAIQLVAAIAVNLIAFISLLAFVNKTLTWLGHRVCLEVDLTFELICGYVLWPISFVIGVDTIDCNRVAELIGTKFFINEFVAYQQFNVYRKNFEEFVKMNGSRYEYNGVNVTFPDHNVTLTGGILFNERSVAISTYALCGFANISSIGMQLAAFSVMLPWRKAELVPLIVRGVITGTLTNLLTASVAGIFFQPGL